MKPAQVAAISALTASTVSAADSDDKSNKSFSYTPAPVPIAAVFASIVVGALGTDDKDMWFSEYVSPVNPHLVWSARISALSLIDDVRALIDWGAPVKLISEETVS